MGLFICISDVDQPDEHCSFEYTVEASSLGWAPGFFPEELETNLGNKQNFVRVCITEEKAMYIQLAGCISLAVFND